MYGAALVGQPYISMGFTQRLGWAHTVNAFDAMDTFELSLAPGGYAWDQQVKPFEVLEPVQLKVREASGKQSVMSFPRLRSLHGPVVFVDQKRGRRSRFALAAEGSSSCFAAIGSKRMPKTASSSRRRPSVIAWRVSTRCTPTRAVRSCFATKG